MSKNYVQIKKLMFTQPEVRACLALPLLACCRAALHMALHVAPPDRPVNVSLLSFGAGAACAAHAPHVPLVLPHPSPPCAVAQVLHALLQNLADAVVTYIKYQVGCYSNI